MKKPRIPFLSIATDAEFQTKINCRVTPIGSVIEDSNSNQRFYIHPNASPKVLAKARQVEHKIFEYDFAILDFLKDVYGYDVKNLDGTESLKNLKCVDIHIFWSFKDLEFLFAEKDDYVNLLLNKLERTRRIRISNDCYTSNGLIRGNSVSLPYAVQLPDNSNNGKKRWFKISMTLSDISAMQGNTSLKEYASNVGIEMIDKETYTALQKTIMIEMYLDNPFKFERYTKGDGLLIEIKKKTTEFYNHIAELIGIEKRDLWGMSTGKIVATILNDWLCKKLNITSEDLYKMHSLAGCEGITNISKILKSRDLLYGGMVDGGRAVKERLPVKYYGTLIDIDIDGCYGNGLKNQKYAIGRPTIESSPILLKDWLKKYDKELIPGLWYARISWENASFKQDVLISKTDEKFSTWTWVIDGFDPNGFEIEDDDKKIYDASMALTTNSIHYASLNHDLWQAIKSVASNREKSWLLNNAVINSSLVYKKSDRVDSPTAKMLEGVKLSKDSDVLLESSSNWIEIDLKELVTILLTERKKHKKKTPMNTFLKLIINTIYGCIASEFFSIEGSCVSSVVVGNNITARARCLAWCMAKGFHSAMSVTDGGVFDVNKVLVFKEKSLNLLEGLHRDKLANSYRRTIFAKQKPLLGFEVDFKNKNTQQKIIKTFGNTNELATKVKTREKDMTIKDCVHKYCLGIIDKLAWEHLANIFDIDIFTQNQFSFDSKNNYIKLILHSKVDYLLEPINGKKVVAFRGMDKVYNPVSDKKEINPICYELFNAIENNQAIIREVEGERMLSLKDYQDAIRLDTNYPLLPHDTVSRPKHYYSIVPLDLRHHDLKTYKSCKRDYEKAKKEKNPLDVAKIRDKYLEIFNNN